MPHVKGILPWRERFHIGYYSPIREMPFSLGFFHLGESLWLLVIFEAENSNDVRAIWGAMDGAIS